MTPDRLPPVVDAARAVLARPMSPEGAAAVITERTGIVDLLTVACGALGYLEALPRKYRPDEAWLAPLREAIFRVSGDAEDLPEETH